MALIAGAVAVLILIGLGIFVGTHLTDKPAEASKQTDTPAQTSEQEVKLEIVSTEPTANDAAITLPKNLRKQLRAIGRAHQQIAWTSINASGDASRQIIDLTPRVSDDPDAKPVKIPERATEVIGKKIDKFEYAINSQAADSNGHSLYTGLTKIAFSGAPVVIISSGLDLSSPIDFRKLAWSVPASKVVEQIKDSREQANLHDAQVLFVVVPSVGGQPQLREAQKTYRNNLWKAVLHASKSGQVTFIDTTGTAALSHTPADPVPIPNLPTTPEIEPQPDPADPTTKTCPVSSAYFVADRAILIDPDKTVHDLKPCIQAAQAAGATYELDGWTSYDGTLTTHGKPKYDSPKNRRLSRDRVKTIAHLMVDDLDVRRSKIVRMTGHGNVDQPNSNPSSPKNRLVLITYHTK
jgi:hypothetical protein